MSSHKLKALVLLSLFWMANPANADWQPYSTPVNGPTYGTSDGLSAVDWSGATYLASADYESGVYYSTDEGESWTLGDEINGKYATYIICDPYVEGNVYIARDAAGEEGFWVSENGGVDFEVRNGSGQNSLTNTSITSIYIDPNELHPIYVTCAAIGTDDDRIFKTTDEGQSWNSVFENFPMHDGSIQFDVTAMYILQGHPDEIWTGSGGLSMGTDSELLGVWHSSDGGENWNRELGGILVGPPGEEYYPLRSIRKIVQNPNFPEETGPYCYANSIRLIEATTFPNFDLYKRNDQTAEFDEIFEMRSHSGLEVWSHFNSFQMTKSNSSGDIFCFFSLSHPWVGENHPEYLDAGIIRVNISGPPLYPFESLNTGIFVPFAVSLAIDPQENMNMYAGSRGGAYGEPSYDAYGGVFKSTDFGDSWNEITKGMHTCASLDLIAVGNVLWAGGTQPDPTYQGNMLTVKNQGESWSNRFVHGSNSFRDFVVGYAGHYIGLATGAENVGEDSIYFSYDDGNYFQAEFGQEPALQAHAYAMANYGNRYYASWENRIKIVEKDVGVSNEWFPFDTDWPTGVGNEAMGLYASPSGNVWAGSRSLGIWYAHEDNPSHNWLSRGLDNLDDISTIMVYSDGTGPDSLLVGGIDEGTTNPSVLWSRDEGSTWIVRYFEGEREFVKGWGFHPTRKYVIVATTEDILGDPHVYLSLVPWMGFRDFSEGLDPNVIHEIKDVVFTTSPTTFGYTLNIGTDAGIFKRGLIIADPVIDSDTFWTPEEPVFVLGDLTIPSGKTLTIEPGTKVYFAPDYDEESSGLNSAQCEIIVNGTLNVEGSEGSHINFEPWTATDGRWGGIVAYGTVNLEDCDIKSANDAIVAFDNATVNLSGCNISDAYTGITAFYPDEMNVAGTIFENCADYAIQVQNLYAPINLAEISILGEFKDGIRYFGNDPGTALLLDGAEIVKDPTYDGTGISIGPDEKTGEYPVYSISNAHVMGFEQGIYLSESQGASQIGPNVRSEYNINGILIDNSWVNIDGSEGVNIFENNEITGLLGYYSSGRVRYSKFIGSPLCIDIEKNGDVIDFGLDDPEEEWGNNSIIANPEGSEMLFYVNDCQFEYPAMMNWWGSDEPEESLISECVIWDPPLKEAPPDPKLASDDLNLPRVLTLSQAFPNPFNAQTTIRFTVPKSTMASVTIYNILGQEINQIYNRHTEAGEASVIWDGKDYTGNTVASGVYLYAVRTDDEVKVNKMMLLK